MESIREGELRELEGDGCTREGELDLDGDADECKVQSLADDHWGSASERLPREVAGLGHAEEGDGVRDVP